jgi:hypothetical protein
MDINGCNHRHEKGGGRYLPLLRFLEQNKNFEKEENITNINTEI